MGKLRQFFRVLLRHIPVDYLLIAVVLELFVFHLVLIIFFDTAVSTMVIEWLLLPFIPAYWVQFRLSSRMRNLAQRERRMELAVTLLTAREHILSQMKKPILYMSIAFATPFVIAIILLAISDLTLADIPGYLFFIFIAVIYSVVFTYISLAGLFDSVYWSCMDKTPVFLPRKFPMFVYRFVAPLPTALAALGMPALIVFLIIGPVIIPGFYVIHYSARGFVYMIMGPNGTIGMPVPLSINTTLGIMWLVLTPMLIIGFWGILGKIKTTRRIVDLIFWRYALPFVLFGFALVAFWFSISPWEADVNWITRIYEFYIWDGEISFTIMLFAGVLCFSPAAFAYSRWLFESKLQRACRAYYSFE